MVDKNGTVYTKDICIIGAGPAGLFAAFECGMLGFSVVLVDSLEHSGGQCTALYPEKPIYDIPAYPYILAGDLIEQLEAQAAPFNPDYLLGQSVDEFSGSLGAFRLRTSKGNSIDTKAVIIAGGAGCFGPNRPPLTGIELFEGCSVFYSIRHKESLRGKKIMIAGGGDSAVDWALALVGIADRIHVVHRRDKFRAAPASLAQLKTLTDEGRIILHTPYQLKALSGQDGALNSVTLENLDGDECIINVDILLPFFGLSTELGAIADWGLALHKNTILIDPTTASTSIKGVYAAGDIAHYEHKLKLILNGFSEGAIAAHSARRDLYPNETYHFEYSTSKGVPSK